MEKKTELKELEDRINNTIDWGKSFNHPAKLIKDIIISSAFLCVLCGWFYFDYDSEWARDFGYWLVITGVAEIGVLIVLRIIQFSFALRVLILVKKLPETHPLAKKIYKDSEEAWEEYND